MLRKILLMAAVLHVPLACEAMMKPATRLMRAVGDNNIDYVTEYLEKGGSVKILDEVDQSQTLLHIACQKGYLEMVKLLMENKADPLARDILGSTPLHYAALNGHDEVLTFLVAHDNVIYGYRFRPEDTVDLQGSSPLHDAARAGHRECVVMLLSLYKNPDVGNCSGNTPLHYAAMCGHEAVVDLLINRGADPTKANGDGKTSSDLAVKHGYGDLAQTIEGKIQRKASDKGQAQHGGCAII